MASYGGAQQSQGGGGPARYDNQSEKHDDPAYMSVGRALRHSLTETGAATAGATTRSSEAVGLVRRGLRSCRPKEPIRCSECGCRIMYKKRVRALAFAGLSDACAGTAECARGRRRSVADSLAVVQFEVRRLPLSTPADKCRHDDTALAAWLAFDHADVQLPTRPRMRCVSPSSRIHVRASSQRQWRLC